MDNNPTRKPLAVPVGTALEISGLGRTKLYELIKEGKLKTVAIGRRRLINFASLEALVAPDAA
jgi:excisionase family DNA binding protein